MTKDQILAALPGLDKQALQAIQTVIQGLLGEKATAGHPDDPTGLTGWLIEAMQPYGPLLISYQAKFKRYSPTFIDFMRQHFAETLNKKITALALMRYLLNLLADDLRQQGLPASSRIMTQNLHRIGEVFEKNFPGYGEGKAAALIATSLLHK